jgi:DNA-binding CsgD family transcriptional regulator
MNKRGFFAALGLGSGTLFSLPAIAETAGSDRRSWQQDGLGYLTCLIGIGAPPTTVAPRTLLRAYLGTSGRHDENTALISVRDDGASRVSLTPREHEVLAAMADGASNKVIARRLGISLHTAKFHVAAILAKLDADSRTEAVARAAHLGLVML